MIGRALSELRNGVTLEEAERRIWEWWQRGWVMASDIEGQTTRMLRRDNELPVFDLSE